jgi:hypothetical protein
MQTRSVGHPPVFAKRVRKLLKMKDDERKVVTKSAQAVENNGFVHCEKREKDSWLSGPILPPLVLYR